MWSLSFHPNIIKMIGYTDSPRTIITRMYPTDLFRFLHAQVRGGGGEERGCLFLRDIYEALTLWLTWLQDDKSELESGLMLHFCQGMAAGLAAIHSMGIAHRDIK